MARQVKANLPLKYTQTALHMYRFQFTAGKTTSNPNFTYPLQVKNQRRTDRQRPVLRVPIQPRLHLLHRPIPLLHERRLDRHQRVLLDQHPKIRDPIIRHPPAAPLRDARRVLQHRPRRAQRVYENLAPVRRQQMTRDLPPGLARHLQHHAPPVQQEVDQTQRRPRIHVHRRDAVHRRAVLQLRPGASARSAPLQGHGLVLEPVLDGADGGGVERVPLEDGRVGVARVVDLDVVVGGGAGVLLLLHGDAGDGGAAEVVVLEDESGELIRD